jgi:hypothetical protein
MIKILFLSSNPDNTSALQLDEEIRSITNKIRASDYRDVLALTSLWAVRPDDLLQALNEHKPQIVHFSGHGSSEGEIVLMDNNRNIKSVSTAALKMLFTTLKDNIRVVILNACYSRTQAEAITGVIDCAIGMKAAIGDQAAITFAASFYRAIGFGRSVQEAFDQGKTALLLEGIPDNDVPELLVRTSVNPASMFLLEDPNLPQSALKQNLTETIIEEFLPQIEDAQILRGNLSSGHALEILFHNRSHKEAMLRRATVGCWKPDTCLYCISPPTYTYELNLESQTYSGQKGGFSSIQGEAKEPQDVWGRPASGYFLESGGHFEFSISFPLYLLIAPGERGLLRVVLRNPQLNRSNTVASSYSTIDRSVLESAPTFGESPDPRSGETWIVLEGDWGQPIAAKIRDHTILKLFNYFNVS